MVGSTSTIERMQIVPPAEKPQEIRVTTRPKALAFTALSVLWAVLSVGVAFFTPDLSWWSTLRLLVWVLQGIWLLAAICLWRLERPREITVKHGMPDPPVIHAR
jgi:membrane protein YdbS with pleckstrin-like domain